MDTFIIGVVAGTLCTLSFIPQVLKIYKSKNAKDLSLPAFSALAAGVSLWLIYGVIIKDLPIIFANGITLVLVITIVIMKIKYSSKN